MSTLQKLLHQSFHQHAALTAVVYDGREISYEELNRLTEPGSGRFAFYKQHQRIAVCVNSRLDMLLAGIAVFRARAVFIPIDTRLPDERIHYILETTSCDLLITDEQNEARLTGLLENAIAAPEIIIPGTALSTKESVTGLPDYHSDDDLYIYFTSGSTGRPKAVLGSNRGVAEFIGWQIAEFGLRPGTRFSQFINPGFDAWLRDVLTPLCSGGICVLPAKPELLADPLELGSWLEQNRIHAIHCVPSFFRVINNNHTNPSSYPGLNYVFLSGERIVPAELSHWYDRVGDRVQLVNFYGPTETTMIKFFYRIRPEDVVRESIPAGKPISGTELFLLDKQLRPVGSRLPGEIYIYSTGATKGYLNDREATGRVFITSELYPGRILYKTGDIGVIQSDGNLVLKGRIDRQLKVLGVRVDPEEIELRLMQHPAIEQAIVTPARKPGAVRLLAYAVCRQAATAEELREYLSRFLPSPMIPAAFIFIGSIPLKLNGKIDYAALPEENESIYIAPENATEKKLASLWAAVLNQDESRIGRLSGFFELGGHSLNAVVLAAQIEKIWQIGFPVTTIFSHSLLSEMARMIDAADNKTIAAIPPAPARPYYQLSPTQERLYFLQQYDPQSTAYNITSLFRVEGTPAIERFREVIARLAERHAGLRTRFVNIDGVPYQQVNEKATLELEIIQADAHTWEAAASDFIRPFDLSAGPLVRAGLIQYGPASSVLVFDVHHSVCDGTSLGIIVRDALMMYKGQTPEATVVQYTDYSEWINSEASQNRLKVQRSYWLTQLAGELPVMQLPCDFERPARLTLNGFSYRFVLPQELFHGLRQLSSERKTTLYNILLTGYAVLLYRLSGQRDMVIGTIGAGRCHASLLHTVGMFANTLALRLSVEPDDDLRALLDKISRVTTGALDNQEYPFEQLVRELVDTRDAARSPLFDVMFNLQNLDIPSIATDNVTFTRFDLEKNISKFDLTLRGIKEHGRFEFTFEYNTRLFTPQTIERFAGYLQRIYQSFIEQPATAAAGIGILTVKELQEETNLFRGETIVYPDHTPVAIFEACAKRHPSAIAVEDGTAQLTYKELNEASEALAGHLAGAGIGHGDTVALMLAHSPELIISVLAVLKCGAAFLPVDAAYPHERKQYMIDTAAAKAVITADKAAVNKLKNTQVIYLPEVSLKQKPVRDNTIRPAASPDGLAYIIFTSGTSGRPKGVRITNRSLANYACFGITEYIKTSPSAFAFFTSVSFDLTLTSVFVPLLSGNKICIYRPGKNEALLPGEILAKDEVTVLKLTPSHLRLIEGLKESPARLNTIIVGGEALSYELAFSVYRRFKGRVALINEYGPTEATVGCMYHRFNPGEIYDSVPIGKPIPNNNIYLLNEHRQPVPQGVTGEIFIGGSQVAAGYTGDAALTEAKFVPDPYEPGKRCYRTGDLAKRLEDGSLLYLGRADEQVKFRGYRIEPAEIENHLLRYEGITAVVVTTMQSPEEGMLLVACFTATGEPDRAGLRNFLSDKVPAYMMPTHFVQLKNIPLTSNGKVDKTKLPLPPVGKEKTEQQEIVARTNTNVAEVLKKIWSQVLVVPAEEILHGSDFFSLGGHSLTAITLVSKVQKETGLLLSLGDVFDASGFDEQVKLIASKLDQDQPEEDEVLNSPVPVERRSSYPLSSVQRRLHFLYQLTPDSVSYNIPLFFTLQGEPDLQRTEEAFREIIRRHENFRTVFRMHYGEARQVVLDEMNFTVESYSTKTIEQAVELFVRPFRLEEGPLFRIAIADTQDAGACLMIDIHHIISDEITFERLMQEFCLLYEGRQPDLPLLQYKDFTVWQQEDSSYQEQIARQKLFWLDRLQGDLPLINLPADFTRPAIKSMEGNIVSRKINGGLLEATKALAAKSDATLYMLLLSVYHILISKLCTTEDVISGTITSGRRQAELQQTMGVFVNTVILRTHPSPDRLFTDYLRSVKEITLASFENQDYPYEDLLENLNIERDISRNPLFEIMFNMHPVELRTIQLQDISAIPYHRSTGTTKFDLNLQINQSEEELEFQFYYSTAIFKQNSVEKWADYYINLLQTLAAASGIRIGDMELPDPATRIQLIDGFNATKKTYDRDQLIHRLFEQQVIKDPSGIAVTDGNRSFTYQQLNTVSNRLAHALIQKGIKPGKFAGIVMDRSVYTVAAVVAVLKSGGAYIPLEPYLPDQRIQTIVSSLQVSVLITDAVNTGKVFQSCGEEEAVRAVYCIDEEIANEFVEISRDGAVIKEKQRDENPVADTNADTLAYVIFTSGSTGTPKGVAVKHRPVINLIEWVNTTYGIGSKTKLLFTTSLAFDLSVYDIFGILAAGGTVRVATRQELAEPSRLIGILRDEDIHFWDSAPAALQQLLPYFEQLKNSGTKLNLFFLSGDWIPLGMQPSIKNTLPEARVVALGGATEATVWSNYFDITTIDPAWRSIPYGKPIQNARYYILDSYKKPCPVGVKGDLYIGGECLASGYINDPELTRRKFVADPFVKNGTMYYTGDKARWFDDGNIEFLGREDAQVKIRGYRVELGEIEHHLQNHPGMKSAKVIARKNSSGQQYLCAYYLGAVTDEAVLRSRLSQHLPEYMVPPFFVHLDDFPVTANGKLDLGRLPDPVFNDAQPAIHKPENEIQAIVKEIWADVLNTPSDRIGVESDFFRAGGNSLSATLMLSRVQKQFNVNVPLIHFFRKPTIRDTAAYLEHAGKAAWTPIVPVAAKEFYRLSPAQQRMYTFQYLNPDMTAYNILVAFRLKGIPDVKAIESALGKVTAMHESLRTSFDMHEAGPVQKIHDTVFTRIEQLKATPENIDRCIRSFKRPFTLHEPPLFRVALIRIAEEDHVLVLDVHHIIADGVSMDIMVRDFMNSYANAAGTAQELQYKDYVEWYFTSGQQDVSRQREFWLKQLAGPLPELKLPGFERRNGLPSYQGATIRFALDANVYPAMNRLETEEMATPYMILLAALNVFLARLSGQEDITIGTPVAGRRHPDLQKIVGVFVNVLAMRNYPAPGKTFRELLKEVRMQVIRAFDHQEYQFEDLVNELLPERSWSKNPLFDVYFFMDNIGIAALELPGLEISLYEEAKQSAQYDLMLGMAVKDGIISGTFSYRPELFDAMQMEQWCTQFRSLLACLLANPDQTLSGEPQENIPSAGELAEAIA